MKPYYLLALLGCAYAQPTDLMIVRDTDSIESSDQAETPAEWVAAISSVASSIGTAVLAGAAAYGVYHQVATALHNDSQDKDKCGYTYITKANNNGIYMYTEVAAGTTGKNCDTTAEEKTIEKAIDDCATFLHNHKAEAGCCTLRHGGGTWRGYVKLARHSADLKDITCSNNI